MQWRPRPPTLLSAKQQKDTKKSLKKYTSQFETKDKMRMTKASKVKFTKSYYKTNVFDLNFLQEVIDKRRKLIKEFEEYRSKRLDDWNKQKAERMAIRSRKQIFFVNISQQKLGINIFVQFQCQAFLSFYLNKKQY